ncbi:MAG: PLP-dependent transferase [Clostridia bacterium]|nr:PLP-dependent transferase [Clostridia bacterium]
MEKKPNGQKYGFQTRSIHSGNGVDEATGAIQHPITLANSYVLPYDASAANWSDPNINIYTRNGGANQKDLQNKLADLENGEDCVVLASGVAALSGLFFAMLKSGDHVIFSKITYIAVYRLFNELFNKKFNVETTIVDVSDLEAVKAAIRPNTKLIHVETPGNPTLQICDIRALAKIAHDNNAFLSVDNTFCSPYVCRPIELGADFVVESLTKYINGHGDAMGGAVIGKKEYLDEIRYQSQVNLGGTISPFNAWLIMRGAVTFPMRMQRHNDNAMAVARFLKTVKGVSFVAYPGLEDHKDHDIAVSQMENGFGGVLSFGLNADHDTYNRFVSHLKLITSAVSLGHDGTLIAFIGENDERQYLYPEEFHNGFFRMSVGLEDAEDIIDDLKNAFELENLI